MTALLEYLNRALIICSRFLQYNLVVFDPISSQPLKGYSNLTSAHTFQFQPIPFSGLSDREVKAKFLKSCISITHVLHMVGVFVITP